MNHGIFNLDLIPIYESERCKLQSVMVMVTDAAERMSHSHLNKQGFTALLMTSNTFKNDIVEFPYRNHLVKFGSKTVIQVWNTNEEDFGIMFSSEILHSVLIDPTFNKYHTNSLLRATTEMQRHMIPFDLKRFLLKGIRIRDDVQISFVPCEILYGKSIAHLSF